MCFGDCGNHAASGRTIKLGQHQPGNIQRVVKRFCLAERVLAGICIQHQQYFMWRTGQGFANHAFNFFDLFHQVCLGGQAACGIRQYNIDFARLGCLHRVKNNGCSIATLLGNHCHIVARPPFHQLFASSGTESVARGQQH